LIYFDDPKFFRDSSLIEKNAQRTQFKVWGNVGSLEVTRRCNAPIMRGDEANLA
jgi:hypothetical protein